MIFSRDVVGCGRGRWRLRSTISVTSLHTTVRQASQTCQSEIIGISCCSSRRICHRASVRKCPTTRLPEQPQRQAGTRPHRKEGEEEWAKVRKDWDTYWRKKIFYGETKGVNAHGTNIAFDPRYLAPNCFSVGFCAGITYGAHSRLFLIRQRGPAERTSSHDHLGLNSDQFTDEILCPGLAPLGAASWTR